MSRRTCSDCEFFDSDTHQCRKNPPVITITTETAWPVVNPARDWCGEFVLKLELEHEQILKVVRRYHANK